VVSITPSPTLEQPTPSPEPTLTNADAKNLVINLLQNNGGCQLPCIWGITPKKTALQDTVNFVTIFGNSSLENDFEVDTNIRDIAAGGNSEGGTSANIWNMTYSTYISFGYYGKDNRLERLTLFSSAGYQIGSGLNLDFRYSYNDKYSRQLLSYYSLQHMLANYGQPSEIYFDTDEYLDEIRGDYVEPISLAVVDYNHGYLLNYLIPRQSVGGYYIAYPSQWYELSLVVWDPANKPANLTQAAIRNPGELNVISARDYKPIEQVSALSVEEFYKIFKNPNYTGPIKIKAHIWTNN
jgi:hypothetical protein